MKYIFVLALFLLNLSGFAQNCFDISGLTLTQSSYSGTVPNYNCTYTFTPTATVPNQMRTLQFVIGTQTVCYNSNGVSMGSCNSTGNNMNAADLVTTPSFTMACGLLNFTISASRNNGPCTPTGVNSLTVNSDGSPLPVKLAFFEGSVVNSKIIISWNSIEEFNFNQYKLEKSNDALNFETIASIERKSFGFYEISDNHPFEGDNYYRLKMIDIDGSVSYSKIISAFFKNGSQELSVFPNPSLNGKINVYGADEQELKLFSTDGREVFFSTLQKGNFLELIPKGDTNGILILKNNKGDSKKIILN